MFQESVEHVENGSWTTTKRFRDTPIKHRPPDFGSIEAMGLQIGTQIWVWHHSTQIATWMMEMFWKKTGVHWRNRENKHGTWSQQNSRTRCSYSYLMLFDTPKFACLDVPWFFPEVFWRSGCHWRQYLLVEAPPWCMPLEVTEILPYRSMEIWMKISAADTKFVATNLAVKLETWKCGRETGYNSSIFRVNGQEPHCLLCVEGVSGLNIYNLNMVVLDMNAKALVASCLVMYQFIMVGLCTVLQRFQVMVHFVGPGPWVSWPMARGCERPPLEWRIRCPMNRGFRI